MGAKTKSGSGQALIEMVFILPLIITLIMWLLQGVEVVRASAEHQKYLRLNLFLRLNNYAKYTVDALGASAQDAPTAEVNEKDFMSLKYDPDLSQKKLAASLGVFEKQGGAPVLINTKYGICIRPICK